MSGVSTYGIGHFTTIGGYGDLTRVNLSGKSKVVLCTFEWKLGMMVTTWVNLWLIVVFWTQNKIFLGCFWLESWHFWNDSGHFLSLPRVNRGLWTRILTFWSNFSVFWGSFERNFCISRENLADWLKYELFWGALKLDFGTFGDFSGVNGMF